MRRCGVNLYPRKIKEMMSSDISSGHILKPLSPQVYRAIVPLFYRLWRSLSLRYGSTSSFAWTTNGPLANVNVAGWMGLGAQETGKLLAAVSRRNKRKMSESEWAFSSHRTRRGPRFDLSSQRKFQQYMKI